MTTDADVATGDGVRASRADRLVAAIQAEGERVADRQVETAVAKLDARGSLTDDRRAAIQELGATIARRVLAAPTQTLRTAGRTNDEVTVDATWRLFDADLPTDGTVSPTEVGRDE